MHSGWSAPLKPLPISASQIVGVGADVGTVVGTADGLGDTSQKSPEYPPLQLHTNDGVGAAVSGSSPLPAFPTCRVWRHRVGNSSASGPAASRSPKRIVKSASSALATRRWRRPDTNGPHVPPLRHGHVGDAVGESVGENDVGMLLVGARVGLADGGAVAGHPLQCARQ